MAELEIDTLDHAAFPSSGFLGGVSWAIADDALGASAPYQKLESGFGAVASLGRTTGILVGRFETALDDELPIFARPLLGGFRQLSGYARNELSGQHLGYASLTVRHRLAGKRTESFGFPIFVGASIEAGNTWETRRDVMRRFRSSGSVFCAVGTPLGPTYVGYGLAESGTHAFYLFVGQVL